MLLGARGVWIAPALLLSGRALAQGTLEIDAPQLTQDRIAVHFSPPIASKDFDTSIFRVEVRGGGEIGLARVQPRGLAVAIAGDQRFHESAELFPITELSDEHEYRVVALGALANALGGELASDWVRGPAAPVTAEGLDLRGPDLKVDLRTAEGAGDFGVDYVYQLLNLASPYASGAWGLRVSGSGRVKTTTAAGVNVGLNQVKNGVSFYWEHLFFDGSGDTLASFLILDGHANNEATQDFASSTWATGATLSFDLGFLLPGNRTDSPSWLQSANFLDTAQAKRAIEAPRFAVSFDRVSSAADTTRFARTGDASNDFNRLSLEGAWRLPVMDEGTYLELHWKGFYDLDADRRSFEDFLEIAISTPLGSYDVDHPSDLNGVLKYLSGALPPNFGEDHALVAGIQLLFG